MQHFPARTACLALAAVLLSPALPVAAQTAEAAYPTRPIQVVVPAAAGGNLDITMRVVGQKMGEILGQPIVVQNRVGANSLIGTRFVAQSAPDGYTLLAIANTFAIVPSVLLNPGYDPVKDFAGIGGMNRVPLLMVTAVTAPDTTLRDFVARAKQSPGRLSYASGGTGTTTHLAAAMFTQQGGVQMLHIPYKGNAPALPSVINGEIGVIFDPINTSGPLVRDGRFRALGITGASRSSLFPNVPTLAEQGLPGYEFTIYTGLVAPAATPRPVIARLHAALAKVTASPEMRDRFSRDGTEMLGGETPEQYTEFLKQEVARYATVVRGAGIKPE